MYLIHTATNIEPARNMQQVSTISGVSINTLKYRFSRNKESVARFYKGYDSVLTIVKFNPKTQCVVIEEGSCRVVSLY